MDLDFFFHICSIIHTCRIIFRKLMSPKQYNMILNVRKMLTGFFLMKKEFEGLQNKVKPFRILKKKQHRNKRHVLMEFI